MDALKFPSITELTDQMRDRGAAIIFDWMREPGEQMTAERYELFGDPIGRGRSAADTNMLESERLPDYVGFTVRSLHCHYGTMDAGDRERFRESYTLELSILHKVFYTAPLASIPFRGVILPHEAPTPSAEPGDDFGGEYPRYIAGGAHFAIRLLGNPFITKRRGLRFLPVLNGWLDRPVQ